MAFRADNGFTRFMDLVGSGRLEPARSNLYGIEIAVPPVLAANDDNVRRNYQNHYDYVNALADDVTIPGRRITTGQVRSVGAMRRFATDTSFSEMSVSFLLPKDLYHRDMFEKWMNYTASDAENRVTFYNEYTTNIRIKKWEVGSPIVFEGRTNDGQQYEQRLNRVTGVWELYGAFPFDMSAINVNNGPTQLIKLDISFYYERYRFDTVADDVMPHTNASADKVINTFDATAEALGFSTQQADVSQFGV
jgi:hypothetical protein